VSNPRKALTLRLAVGFTFTALLLGRLSAGTQPTAPASAHFSADPAALYQSAMATPAPAGADVVVLEDEDTYVFDAQGRRVHTQYVVFRVLTQKGAENWADYSAPWEPWHEERPVLRARVITPDHAVHELDAKTVTDKPAKEDDDQVYSDRRTVQAPLPAMAPGSVVEEESVSKESAPFFGAGTVGRSFFGRGVPVQHTRLVLDAPASLPLRYALELLPEAKPERREAEGRVQVVFDHGPIPAQEDAEPYLPSEQPAFPRVNFSTGSSWRQVAEEYGKVVDARIAGAEVKALVSKLVAGKHIRQEKAEALLQYLDKEVRYTGVEFGEAAIVPRTPAETLKQKYGDCKDKAVLLVALLRAADVPAYVALLNVGTRQDVPADLPGLGLFDHAIVYAPGEPELWIDVTDEYARLGELPDSDQGRLALVARAGTAGLVRTPVASSRENLLVEKREFYLAEYGPARVVETSQPQGSLESAYRSAYADQQRKKTQEGLTNYMKSQYLAEKLDRLERSDPQDLGRPFELVLESKQAKRGFTDLESAVAAIRLDTLFLRLPAELQRKESEEEKKAGTGGTQKKRTADYQLPVAFVTEWDYTIVPPAGFQPKALPANARIPLGPALLTEEFQAEKDGVVHAVIRFDTGKRRMTAAEAAAMRDGIVQLRNGEALMVAFEPAGQALLRQGKAREAFQAYRAPIAQSPKAAVPHLRLAKAMLAAGMGEAAREEARLAVKLEPDSALAEKTLAVVLEYDLVGRQFRPGGDLAGAEAAFRAAEKLDPEDKEIPGNLAILLEYNPEGTRYGPGAKLKDAVATYRSLTSEQMEKLGIRNNLAFALFYAGEFAEARQNAENLNPQPNALITACEAALHGSEAGLAEANKRGQGEAGFKAIAKAAGDMLMNLRLYPPAADLMEAGASGENASATVGLAAMLRKAHPHEQLHFDNDPAGLVLRMFLSYTDPTFSLETMKSYASRNALAVLQRTDPEELDKEVADSRKTRREFAQSSIPTDVMIDIAMQLLQPKVEGNDATGYLVDLQIPGQETGGVFVVKEEGRYKLLDSTDKPNAVGLAVLDRVAAGDLAGARVLLDWLRDRKHLAGGDDPLAGAAFPRMWTKGKDAGAEQMRLAAAAILVETKPTAAQGVAILETARSSAKSDADKLAISLALLEGYDNLDGQEEKALAIVTELARQYPESKRAFQELTTVLSRLGRFREAEAAAQERLRRMPDDLEAMRAQVRTAVAREDYGAAHRLAQKIVDAGKAEAGDLNALAWYSLFTGTTGPADLEAAVRAERSDQKNASILHTLGCVYAEVGKTKEAREVLVQAMDLLNLDEPDPNYWYAFGRIAEQYGEYQVAAADYAKVTRPKRAMEIPDSSYRLAQMRLKILQGAGKN